MIILNKIINWLLIGIGNCFSEFTDNFYKLLLIMFNVILDLICYYIDLILSGDFFDSFTNIFIGVSSLIIALVIFSIERSVDSKNGSLLKRTLIYESHVENIVRLTIISYLLLLLQLLITIPFIVLIARTIIIYLTFMILVRIFDGFISILGIFIDENNKRSKMNMFLEKEVEKQNKEDNKILEYQKTDLEIIENNFKNENIIKYDFDYFNNDNYDVYKANFDGSVESINHGNLLQICSDIKSNLLKINDVDKNGILILRKLSGDTFKKNDALIYIKKDLFFDPKIIEKIYTTTRQDNELFNVIKSRILDLNQFFVDSIVNNKFLDIKIASGEIVFLYSKLIELKSKHSDYIYTTILEVYRRNEKLELKEDLENLIFNLADTSLKLNVKNDFAKYLNLYYWLREKRIDEDFADTINQGLFHMKISVDNNDNIIDKQDYYIIMLSIKQQMLRSLFEKKLTREIFKNNFYSSKLEIHKVKTLQFRKDSFDKFPERYKNINLSQEVEKLSVDIESKFQELSLNASLYLGLLEWFRSNLDKEVLEEVDIVFLNNIIEKFNEYDWNDILELYLFITSMENRISDVWHQWEFSKPEHKNTVFSPTFNIEKSIGLLIFFADNVTFKNSDLKKVIDRDNMYKFTSLKELVLSDYNLKFLRCTFKDAEIENLKTKLIEYLEKVKEACEIKEKEYLIGSQLPINYDQEFKKTVIKEINNSKKGTVFEIFDKFNATVFSKKTNKEFWGYNRVESKSFFVKNFDEALKFYASNYADGLVNDQSNEIISKMKEISNETLESIDEILTKFKNTDEVFIISPYYINEFTYSGPDEYHYIFKNKKIPVYEVRGLYDEIIIVEKESLGSVVYYKGNRKEFENQFADEYTIARLIDFSAQNEEIKAMMKEIPDWLKEKDNPIDYLKLSCCIIICQKVEYISSKNNNIYKKPIE